MDISSAIEKFPRVMVNVLYLGLHEERVDVFHVERNKEFLERDVSIIDPTWYLNEDAWIPLNDKWTREKGQWMVHE